MYDTIAHYYDLIHSDLREDIKFLLRMADPVNGRVLELGCGTGRLMIPFAMAGYDITGVDHTLEMLAIGRKKVAELREGTRDRISFIEGDMVGFGSTNNFELAFFGHNTFMHIARHKLDRALRNLRSHLSNSGLVVIDVDNPTEVADPSADHLIVLERTFKIPRSGEIVAQSASSWSDGEQQVRHITWIFDRTPAAGGSVHRHVVKTSFHYYYAHQVDIALNGAGFQIKTIYGDYDETPYLDDGPRMIILAEAV